MDYSVEHPDITHTIRTGYPRQCGESPLMPPFKEYEGQAFPYGFIDEREDD